MSEVMTSESIIEAEWLLKGYWTKPRFAFQTEGGDWSDIDVLAYHPEQKHLVVAESKVQTGKKVVFAYNESAKSKYGPITSYASHYLKFCRHLPRICGDELIFSKFERSVKAVTVQLVCNYVIDPELRPTVERDLKSLLTELPVKTANFQIDSTLDVLARIVLLERESKINRRYGNPILDVAREINRYFDPHVKTAGKSKAEIARVRKMATERFIAALMPRASET